MNKFRKKYLKSKLPGALMRVDMLFKLTPNINKEKV